MELVIVGKLTELDTLEPVSLRKSIRELANRFLITKTVKLWFKREKGIWGRVTDLRWKGDATLAQKLNSDSDLRKEMLESLRSNKNLWDTYIFYTKRLNSAVIRIPYFVPNAAEFAIVNKIAHHIKSAWFGS